MQLPKKPKEQEHFTTKKKKKAISQDFIYLFIFEHQPQKLKNQIVTKIWFINFISIIKHQMSPSLQTFNA